MTNPDTKPYNTRERRLGQMLVQRLLNRGDCCPRPTQQESIETINATPTEILIS
jgi:hypothetical protein